MNETDLRIRLCEEIMRDRDLCPMCEELAEIVRKNLEGAAKGRRTGPSDYLPPKNKAWPNYAISLAGAPGTIPATVPTAASRISPGA